MAFFKTEQEKLTILNDKLTKKLAEKSQKEAEHLERMNNISTLKKENTRVYNAIKKKGYTDFSGWITELKYKYMSGSCYLINMELRNGFSIQFLTNTNTQSFKYKSAEYIIDDRLKYYNLSASLWSLDYHQDFSMPVGRKIDVIKLKKATQMKGVTDVDQAINPYNLREFVKSEVVQKILKGADLDKFFTFMRNLIILTLIVSVLTLVLIIRTTGII